jgi:hypothetical protein
MKNRANLLPAVLLACTLQWGGQIARADIVEPTAQLPPSTGGYILPTLCVNIVCLENATISNFDITSISRSGNNELVDTTALFTAQVFANVSGTPGAFLGMLSTTGAADFTDFTFFGRTSTEELGTFSAQIDNFNFAGTFNGHPFDVIQNPIMASTGVATVSQLTSGLYDVSSYFDIYGELSINGSAYVPGPEREATLGTPEPSSWALLITVVGLFAWMVRRTRRLANSAKRS